MKRTILVIICMLFLITGCGKTTIDEPNNSNEKSEVMAGNVKVSLNMSGTFNSMTYKYPEGALTSNVGTYSIMDYMDGEKFVFRIAMYYFGNKTVEDAMKGSKVTDEGTKTINGVTWNVYKGIKDDKKVTNYAYRYGYDAYTITFIYDDDIDTFIDAFINTIKFN